MTIDTKHPLAGQHINQGSMDAAADQYAAEYYQHKIKMALDRAERTLAGHSIGADKAGDQNGYQGGFVAGFRSCLSAFQEALK